MGTVEYAVPFVSHYALTDLGRLLTFTAIGARRIFVGRGGGQAQKGPQAHREKIAKNYQKGPHMKKKAPHKLFFSWRRGKGLLCLHAGAHMSLLLK